MYLEKRVLQENESIQIIDRVYLYQLILFHSLNKQNSPMVVFSSYTCFYLIIT